MEYETGIKIRKKEWDVFVFGDANIDLIIPNVKHLPCAGQEELVDTMKTFVGGGAALLEESGEARGVRFPRRSTAWIGGGWRDLCKSSQRSCRGCDPDASCAFVGAARAQSARSFLGGGLVGYDLSSRVDI